jgi:hypothetical protein
MKPAVRRLALTAHVVASVGWIGAALVFLAIAALALTARTQLFRFDRDIAQRGYAAVRYAFAVCGLCC